MSLEARKDISKVIEEAQASLSSLEAEIVPHQEKLSALEAEPRKHVWELSDKEIEAYEVAAAAIHGIHLRIERQQQKLYRAELGTILEYVDEVELNDYSDILTSPVLKENFYVRSYGGEWGRDRARAVLEKLPFIAYKQTWRHSQTQPATELLGPLMFPVGRIIGVGSFESWAGRAYNPHSPQHYSIDKIIEYAKLSSSVFEGDLNHGICIEIAHDTVGALWGFTTTDGSHRTAAAKLRGDEMLEVMQVYIPAYDDMPLIPFDVSSAF